MDQLCWGKGGAAIFAVVAISFRVTTLRAFSGNEPIRKELIKSFVVVLLGGLLFKLSSFVIQLEEEVPGRFVMQWIRSSVVDVKGNS